MIASESSGTAMYSAYVPIQTHAPCGHMIWTAGFGQNSRTKSQDSISCMHALEMHVVVTEGKGVPADM